MPAPITLSSTDIALRQSIEILQNTIKDLCLRRDQLISELPEAPKQVAPTHFRGRLIKESSWKPKSKK